MGHVGYFLVKPGLLLFGDFITARNGFVMVGFSVGCENVQITFLSDTKAEIDIVKSDFQIFGIQAVDFVDVPIMAAYLVFVALLFVVINLVVDLLYLFVDPRIRLGD